MGKFLLPTCLVVFFTVNLSDASDFGTVGLIDIPSARMSEDATLRITSAFQSRTNSYSITYQATPWLETTFRYTGFNQAEYQYDRNYEMKILLSKEGYYSPQIALGIRDLVGTGVWGSEYLVASKKLANFDLTLGLGWGRLAGDASIRNPLVNISESFRERKTDVGLGGTLSKTSFFRGENIGIFGGVRYQSPILPLSLIMEYNPDQYEWEVSRGGSLPKSPLSAAINWDLSPNFSLTLSHQNGNDWGINFSSQIDTSRLPSVSSPNIFRSSLYYSQQELPSGLQRNKWYDTLLYDAERSGLLILEATIDRSIGVASIVVGNTGYALWVDALSQITKLADLHLPKNIQIFRFMIEEEGVRLHEVSVQRPSFTNKRKRFFNQNKISINPVSEPVLPQFRTDFVRNRVIFDIALASRFQFFDPDDPARYQIYMKIGAHLILPGSWILRGAYGSNIYTNFNESKRASTSVLPHVRSDVIKYLTEGKSGIDSLYLDKRGNVRNNLYYRVYVGLLETMYSGLGGELLYQPFRSRLAYGFSANSLQQRGYKKNFQHLQYQVNTYFGSIYWASPFYNMDVAIHVGKYLAGDSGATLELRRTFDNGWMIGVWATKTNVSAEDFGEGSFDKGLFFSIPLDGLFNSRTRAKYSTRLRPIQRDGGQYIEDFSGFLWWQTRGARYDAFFRNYNRFSQ